MRPGTELALGATVLVVLGVGVVALGSRRARVADTDPRRSTYLVGPSGTSGYAEALGRLGVRVDRYRRPVASLDSASSPGTIVAFLGPAASLTAYEGIAVARLSADLLLAGRSAAAAMRCLGYDVVPWNDDSVAITRPLSSDSLPLPRVRALLRRRLTTMVVDSSDVADGSPVSCMVPSPAGTDTLIRAAGRPVVVRLTFGDRRVTLVSDDRLFSNRTLRETAAGPIALRLVVPGYRRVLVDEYHNGFDATGSLAGSALGWSLRSPWGWAVWQVVVVGVIALLAAGIRFGPAQRIIERRRRSPLEHVRALATALAAARGHDVAVRLIVQGLRRRLGRPTRQESQEPVAWLESLAPAARTARGRAALERLTTVAGRSATSAEVLDAVEDVETLWEELKPS